MNYQLKRTLWISYSGISDFKNCPKLYYLKNLYRTPVTERKIQVVDPYLTLGTVVHRAVDEIYNLEPEKRKDIPLLDRFERIWQFFSGKRGGFSPLQEEKIFYTRGRKMIEKLENSQIIQNPSYTIGGDLPKVRLFPDKDIVLVGGIDWVEILPKGSLHIIDFKTGKSEEEKSSLQLPIYLVLGNYNFKKPVEKTSYWYLEKDGHPVLKKLNTPQFYIPIIQEKALEIKKAIDGEELRCKHPSGKCFKCEKYEKVILNQAECVGFDRKMNRELYFVGEE